jgi:hypothetical protein
MAYSAQRLIALYTIITLVMGGILPYFVPYISNNTAYAANVTAHDYDNLSPDDYVMICTPSGIKWVLQRDLEDGKHEKKQHTQFKCVSCFVGSHQLKHTIVHEFTLPQHEYKLISSNYSVASVHHSTQQERTSSYSRAPPLL